MRVSDRFVVGLTHIDLEGRGVAQVEGRELRVAGGFGGERVEVEVVHVSRGGPVAHAIVRTVTEPDAARREAACARHDSSTEGKCSGCPLMQLGEDAQRVQKRAMLASLGLKVDTIEHTGPALGYRFAAKRIAFGGPGRLRLGSFVRGSHRPAWMQGCLVDHPRIQAAADELELVAREVGIPAWQESAGRGVLRGVWFKTNGDDVLVTLILAAQTLDASGTEADESADATQDEDSGSVGGAAQVDPLELAQQVADALTVPVGVSWAASGGNALRGASATLLRGRGSFEDVGGSDQGALAFLQPNPVVANALYDALLQDEHGAALGGAHLWDLYAGAGVITRAARALFSDVTPVEAHPESAAALGVEPTRVEAFLRAEASTPEVVVANPPRKGLGQQVCDALLARKPPRIHIMSCGPAGLARDLERLGSEYELVSLRAWDTLPQTAHVELLAKLVRR